MLYLLFTTLWLLGFVSFVHGRNEPIHIHYHMQHMAGTTFWALANHNGETAKRACSQKRGECFLSISQEVSKTNFVELVF